MAENPMAVQVEQLTNDLRKISVFSDLPQEHLLWLAERFEDVYLAPGDVFVRAGDPAEWLAVILEGETRFQRHDNPDGPIYSAVAGEVTGYLPFSRLTTFQGTGRAVDGPVR